MNKPPAEESANQSLEALRDILLAREQERIARLEESLKRLQEKTGLSDEQIRETVEELRRQHADTEALINRIAPSMTSMVRRAIRESGDEMAETLGPIMGEAIRVQIRDSRDEMVDTLYPVIGATIQKAIGQFSRELQRNIDARLRSTFGPEGALRRLAARLRGVSASELTLRDALPFDVKEIFLIHRSSGILIAHSHHGDLQINDSDLIGGMLTAIRNFTSDAFQGNDELDEIQFGQDRIVIQNGANAYLAAVISGIEPEGFRSRLTEFVSNLHLRFNNALRDFNGAFEAIPNFQPQLIQLTTDLGVRQETRPATKQQKIGYALAGISALLLLILACFYVVFTVRLLPVAFAQPTLSATITPTMTTTPTFTPSPTSTLTPILTPTPLPPTATPPPFNGFVTETVWVHIEPNPSSAVVGWITPNSHVAILAAYGDWLEVSWVDGNETHRGWVNAAWISLARPLPPEMITPLP